jgi:hypothetical protein
MSSPKPDRGEPLLGNVPMPASSPAPDDEEELPVGLVEAVSEMRSAEDDDTAARALLRAVRSIG